MSRPPTIINVAGAVPAPESMTRYTAYIGFGPYDDGDGESGPHVNWESVEEIDLDASRGVTDDELREFVEHELEAGYEPGGTILEINERIGWYM